MSRMFEYVPAFYPIEVLIEAEERQRVLYAANALEEQKSWERVINLPQVCAVRTRLRELAEKAARKAVYRAMRRRIRRG
jgi:hypothetical protein